ncbi:hypothetical protein [Lagierella massiliensis]|uniref:hypothetical protein n=1 Tax=Lagierella massiliensis TaxID=1689303 RepID=UPI0006D7AB1F|nr:hypothetical protein [Lagierella massiliensis]
MSKNGKVILGILVALILGVVIYRFNNQDQYKNLVGETYSYTFKEDDKEYQDGYRYNIIFFDKDSVTIYEAEEIGELPDNVDIDQKGDRQVNRKFLNPVYNEKEKTVTADDLEETIKIVDADNIEYNGKVYIKEVK